MKVFSSITTSRLIIREWRADEVTGMHRWLSDPQVNHFLSFATHTIAESAQHLEQVIASQNDDPRVHYYLALELIETGETIGDAGFSWVEPDVAEIGYFLEPAYWRKGFATEAAKVLIDFAFDQNAARVLASCDIRNTHSELVMKRCGMRKLNCDDPGRLLYGLARGTRL